MVPGFFPYTNFPHQEWPALLERFDKKVPFKIYVPWGSHEREKGVIDFSRSTKLCLERLLERLQVQGALAEICLGFAGSESIPAWAWGELAMIQVPSLAIFPHGLKHSLVRVPDFGQEAFQEAFFRFTEEVLLITELYKAPEGPVKTVTFDPGFYKYSYSVPHLKWIDLHLQSHYGSVKKFNQIFGTNFPDMTADDFVRRLPLLIEKRAWVACYDLRKAHELAMKSWEKNMKIPSGGESKPGDCYDFTLMVVGDQVLPYFPGGKPFPQILNNCRAASSLNADFRRIENSKLQVALTSKWISREMLNHLQSLARSGQVILLLPGVPVYDENMEIVSDFGKKEGEPLNLSGSRIVRYTYGSGALMAPELPIGNWETLIDAVKRTVENYPIAQVLGGGAH